MVAKQGDIFWINLPAPRGSGPGFRHPHVVVQNNVFNTSAINTTIVAALTSNIKRAQTPGNVLLNKNEANLPKASVVNVSQLFTVDKSDLDEKLGTLSKQRIEQVITGIELVIKPREL